MKYFFPFAVTLTLFQAFASPHPGTATSVLTDPEKGQAFRAYGFKLELGNVNWRPAQKDNETLFAEIEFHRNDEKTDATKGGQISLRMDDIAKTQTIETYAKKWMRDYPHYGFEVLGTKTFAPSSGQGLVVDLFHRQNNKQLRQVILLKDKKVAIITCSNEKPKFAELLTECNQLVKNFTWLEVPKKAL